MEKKYDGIARIAVAGGITAIGLTLGGVAIANAADSTGNDSASTGSSSSSASDGPRFGGHRGGPANIERAALLAERLGLDEEKVADALDAVRDELPRPEKPAAGEERTPPTAADREERDAAFAKALAAELDVTTAAVSDALAGIDAERQAGYRTDLSTRLDTAVDAGDLTAADKASVLKAFDAGVLGGGPGGR